LIHDEKTVVEALIKMAARLHQDYEDKVPIFMVVMNGGLIFAGQLLPLVDIVCQIDYCHATRYRGDTEGKDIQWRARPQQDLKDRDVVIVDDILDEGHTLVAITEACIEAGAKSVKTCVLIEKEHDRKARPNLHADYSGLTVPDRYVFGYGM
ncbi:MAG: hypoxanthine-guanine phosphoribosyltransferase, partial [Phototrophicales bacterium]